MNCTRGGIGPCIVIGAIYGKKGYMFHEIPVGCNSFSRDIEPIFKDLKRDVKDKNQLQIYIIGGEIEVNDESESDIRAGRQTVLEKIARNGFSKAVKEIRWCPLKYNQSLRLVLSEGRAEIEEDPNEDLIDD